MSESTDFTAKARAIVARSPYLGWLGLEVESVADGEITARARWREEWVANPDRGQTQGGILAALVDFGASFSLLSTLGTPAVTIDIRVDYHRMSRDSDLLVRGRVIKLGRTFSVCEAQLFDKDDKLVASGRGSFLSAA